ncbi:MAG: hypothetical protein LBK01_06820 [Burkholderiaceae bacterium]|jgi:hypothetical protein|nr:hypothetical protein [Burkholderiaceae bacterium]
MLIPNRFNGYSPDGIRLYHKKGGSSSSYYEQVEQERQQRIAEATNAINGIFDSANRQTLYDEQRQAVTDLNAKSAMEQYEDAQKANKFALARSGLLGGSADVDSNANLEQRLNEGLVKAVGLGDSASANLQKADESTKSALLSMAQSGIDTGTAQSMALNNLNANYQSALGANAGSALSGLFADMSAAYLNNQMNKALQTGYSLGYNNWQPLSTGSGSSGTIYDKR